MQTTTSISLPSAVAVSSSGPAFVPRDYQTAAVESAVTSDGTPLIVMPTGAGKSIVVAEIARRTRGRSLIAVPSKELVRQNIAKVRTMAPDVVATAYCAGLGAKDSTGHIVAGSINSLFRAELGRFEQLIIDEAHRVPKGGGMYPMLVDSLRRANPAIKFIGLTATPFRLEDGYIFGDGQFFSHVCHETGIEELVDAGYLAPLISVGSKDAPDFSKLRVKQGEFDSTGASELLTEQSRLQSICEQIVAASADREATLIFCCDIRSTVATAECLRSAGLACEIVTSETPQRERDRIVAAFVDGEIDCLANCGILTTGFDCPRLDLIALLRPTMSTALYVQILGRGTRTHPGKSDCLILDFGGNLKRHGPVDSVQPRRRKSKTGKAPMKRCRDCGNEMFAGVAKCPFCGADQPKEAKPLEERASTEVVMGGRLVDVSDTRHRLFSGTYGRTVQILFDTADGRLSSFVPLNSSNPKAEYVVRRIWTMLGGDTPIPTSPDEWIARLDELDQHVRQVSVTSRSGSKWPNVRIHSVFE